MFRAFCNFQNLTVINKINYRIFKSNLCAVRSRIQPFKPIYNVSMGGITFIHTTSPMSVNPIILLIVKPLSKITMMIAGRGFRKWWQSLPKNKKALITSHIDSHNLKYIVSLSAVSGAAYYLYDTHTVVSPFTGRKKFLILDNSQITEISDVNFTEEMEQYKELVLPQSHPKVIRLKKICQRLFHGNSNVPELHSKFWTLYVVDCPEENCVVYPSGQIVMFSGMIELADNDDQLAVVLAHEMSHVILGHHVEKLSRASLIDVLILLPLALIWAFMPSDGIAAVTHWFFDKVVQIIVNLPFSRSLEAEADSVGLLLAASACFDVREASAFWGRLDVLDNMRNKNDRLQEHIKYFSTHPSHSDRQTQLDELMKAALETRESQQCPKLNKIDPRISVKCLQEQLKQPALVPT